MKKHFKLYQIIICILTLCLVSGCSLFNSSRDYEVSDEYFSYLSFDRVTYKNTNQHTGVSSYKYCIRVTSCCDVSLYEYNAIVSLFSSDDMPIFFKEFKKEVDVSSEDVFTFDLVVDQDIQLSTTKVYVNYSGRSHEKPQKNNSKFNVTFVYNNNTPNKIIRVDKGKTMQIPTDPIKANHIFMGWYLDNSFNIKYDFSSAVTGNIILYASYILDGAKITNEISKNTMHGLVKIYNKSYNTSSGTVTSYSIMQGSGFCFRIQNGRYYVLTNCHVAIKDNSYSYQNFQIEDYLGNTYDGYLYRNPNKTFDAIATSYDLACLYFESSSTNVSALPFDDDPIISSDVISLGAPNGQSNTITFGKVNAYRKVSSQNESNDKSKINFDVIEHTAWIDHGSSGGPLLNTDLQIVGINFGSTVYTQNSVKYHYAIPISKVVDFLEYYVNN